MKKKYDLDIFEVLTQLDIKNRKFYDKLNEEEQITFEKNFNPVTVMKWFTGTYNPNQIYYINEFVNSNLWSFIKDHKRLLFYLLTICAQNGKITKYYWNAKKKSVKYSKTIECLQRYFHYSSKQARECIPLLTVNDVVEYAIELGMQSDEIKVIKSEFK
jgi:hypothetical protein